MSTAPIASLDELRTRIREFAFARQWENYHTPQNLAMALIVEAAELVERFQWLSPEESAKLDPERREQVRQEIADVLLPHPPRRPARINLLEAARDKLEINARHIRWSRRRAMAPSTPNSESRQHV